MAQTPEGDSQPSGGAPNSTEQDLLQLVLSLLTEASPENQDAELCREENRRLRGALSQMTSVLRDKSTTCITMERKVDALNVQVSSLKDVASLTKDLLQIRNMELQHLQQDINSMQTKMTEMRTSHKEVIGRLEKALSLNDQLKTEYDMQLKLFQTLKEKYEQRANLLETINNQRNVIQSNESS